MTLYINGISAISPLGIDVFTFWEGLLNKSDVFALHKGPNACDVKPCIVARIGSELVAEMVSFASEHQIIGSQVEIAEIYALYGCLQALEDAGIDWRETDMSDTAIILGNLEPNSRIFDIPSGLELERDADGPYITFDSSRLPRIVAGVIGAKGPTLTVHNTCASGNAALEYGAMLIEQGVVRRAIVGGVDAFSDRVFSGFSTLGVLGAEPCRPFSKNRKYITISEGAGIAVLEAAPSQSAQGAYAELVAVVSTNDAKHPTAPALEGVLGCHEKLWARSGIAADSIDFVFAHGTGSHANDAVEAHIFLSNYANGSIYALKAVSGHLMGAAGALGLVASALAAKHRLLPPNVVSEAELEYKLNFSETQLQRDHDALTLVQNNAFGFGGSNSISLLRSVPENAYARSST